MSRRSLLPALWILLTGLLGMRPAISQPKPPFWDEVQHFILLDKTDPPPAHGILFIGSSSFRKWTGLRQDFPGLPVINRGFGGSTYPDLMRYAGQLVFPYDPKQVVIYCGDNDIADSVKAPEVYQRFLAFFRLLRSRLPGVDIVFISIKPSPSRKGLAPEMAMANLMIRAFLSRQTQAHFVDVFHQMLTPLGQPNGALFLPDSLHMNPKGYAIWRKDLQPYLLKN